VTYSLARGEQTPNIPNYLWSDPFHYPIDEQRCPVAFRVRMGYATPAAQNLFQLLAQLLLIYFTYFAKLSIGAEL
jgi:hypothetical protein